MNPLDIDVYAVLTILAVATIVWLAGKIAELVSK